MKGLKNRETSTENDNEFDKIYNRGESNGGTLGDDGTDDGITTDDGGYHTDGGYQTEDIQMEMLSNDDESDADDDDENEKLYFNPDAELHDHETAESD